MTTKPQDDLFNSQFLHNIIGWIESNLTPEEVFSRDELADWACENGYVHDWSCREYQEDTQPNPWRELWDKVIDADCWDNEGCCCFCGAHFSETHTANCLFDRADTMMAEEIQSKEAK